MKAHSVPCALGGPFNKLRTTGSQLIPLSVSAFPIFISTSSVYVGEYKIMIQLYVFYRIKVNNCFLII